MLHRCHHCGSGKSRRTIETSLFRSQGYNIRRTFPFKTAHEHIVSLCSDCNRLWRSGRLKGSPPLYHPLDSAPENA